MRCPEMGVFSMLEILRVNTQSINFWCVLYTSNHWLFISEIYSSENQKHSTTYSQRQFNIAFRSNTETHSRHGHSVQ